MSYLVLARKWRPKCFSAVVGQQHVLKALVNSLDADRLHHALLFTGTRGVGKTTLARIVAKSLNCERGTSANPCDNCAICQEVDAGNFVDLIEVDAASRTKVDDTRALLDNVQYTPNRGRYKVYLIDEVHMLSKHSFNALLKTLEEPPPHVKFLFATTDPQQLPPTILSRCLHFNLRRLDINQIADHLADILAKENITFEPEGLTEIARAADGSMRDALSLLDQAISFSDSNVTDESARQMLGTISQTQVVSIISALIHDDGNTLIKEAEELVARGHNVEVMLDQILSALQRIATMQLVPQLDDTGETDFAALQDIATQVSPELVQLFYQIVLHGKRDLPFAADPESGFTMTLLRMLSFRPKDADEYKQLPTTNQAKAPNSADKASNHTNQIVKATSDAPPKGEAIILNKDNWLSIADALKLRGLVGELAKNSAFIDFKDNKLTIAIAPELAHISNEKTQHQLQSALESYLGLALTLSCIDRAKNGADPTLASEHAKKEQLDQQHAIQSINDDKAVNAMQKMLDAKVMTETIKPLNKT